MAKTPKLPPELTRLIEEGLFERLPATFSTYSFDRIKDWKTLFPAERNYFQRLFTLLDRSDNQAVEQLFAPLRAVEEKMGVDQRTWPRRKFTLEHVDFLQRSPHLAEWRQAIAQIFEKIDPLLDAEVARSGRPRLVMVISPAALPMGPDRMWQRIQERGKLIRLSVDDEQPLHDYLPLLLTGQKREARAPTLFDLYARQHAESPYDVWVVEAGDSLHRLAKTFSKWVGLSYSRLERPREELMDH